MEEKTETEVETTETVEVRDPAEEKRVAQPTEHTTTTTETTTQPVQEDTADGDTTEPADQ